MILNQFSELGNHVVHYLVTGSALARLFEALHADQPARCAARLRIRNRVGGNDRAGDYLKERFGSLVVAGEALECPTMLWNGFGEHNIQGIGDKHIPLIHNVLNTDVALAVSERATDRLGVCWARTQDATSSARDATSPTTSSRNCDLSGSPASATSSARSRSRSTTAFRPDDVV